MYTPQHNELHRYSEWLDANGLMADPKPDDKRSHDDLVQEFLAYEEERNIR